MRDALIFAGLVICGVAALFPGTEAPDLQSPLAVRVQPPASPIPTEASSSRSTELARAHDGHFYAPVTVGAQTVTMLVDTGASVVALTGEDARMAGLSWDAMQLATVAQGAGGAVRGVAVTIPLMRLGTHEARDVPAVIIPEGLPISLLGQTFLKDIEPVRIERDRMMLGG